ncbi:uncharacterized protein A4U43_C02F13870 [Asparagus officinalis]|uniref:Uncharacterized protein n=1 Tax=Asparagus officinalis TaxID=4686 RepID=A0A5P1FIY1_ASPOF|nr:uncharacterized protein A4U43_C02F13870 [Asparagus officinalis]
MKVIEEDLTCTDLLAVEVHLEQAPCAVLFLGPQRCLRNELVEEEVLDLFKNHAEITTQLGMGLSISTSQAKGSKKKRRKKAIAAKWEEVAKEAPSTSLELANVGFPNKGEVDIAALAESNGVPEPF